MKWLRDNPLGMVLAGMSGLFLLLALGMAIVWNLPVSVDVEAGETGAAPASQANLDITEIGELAKYEVVNEKPVFNESRQPVLDELNDELPGEEGTIEVKDAPDVRLTGVVITPGLRIASLTPADGNLETVMAREGESLTGEFVGWQVTVVSPRTVTLESRDGQSLELNLQVHDAKIEEPPKPQPAAPATAAANEAGAQTDEEGEEPLSRAEQIRQRIAERREELRLEQEAQQSQSRSQVTPPGQVTKPSDYQSAIRAMMKKNRKDEGSNDKKDG